MTLKSKMPCTQSFSYRGRNRAVSDSRVDSQKKCEISPSCPGRIFISKAPCFHLSRVFNHLEDLRRKVEQQWISTKAPPCPQQQCRGRGQRKGRRAQGQFSPGGSVGRRVSTRLPLSGTLYGSPSCNLWENYKNVRGS